MKGALRLDPARLGAVIRAIRMSRNISIRAVALKAGCTPQNISNVESGKNLPSVPTLVAICEAINVPIDTIMDCIRDQRA